MKHLTVAVPKGRLGQEVATLFGTLGADVSELQQALAGKSRSLVVTENQLFLRFILAKAMDVPTFVQYGSADIGIAGKDVLLEVGANVAELIDLRYSACRFVLAVPEESGIERVSQLDYNCRVASKYVHVARRFLEEHGIQADVIRLHGSVELAPRVGLADAIVDITETGRTLQENGLRVIAEIAGSTARLIANRISYKVHYDRIGFIADSLRRLIEGEVTVG